LLNEDVAVATEIADVSAACEEEIVGEAVATGTVGTGGIEVDDEVDENAVVTGFAEVANSVLITALSKLCCINCANMFVKFVISNLI